MSKHNTVGKSNTLEKADDLSFADTRTYESESLYDQTVKLVGSMRGSSTSSQWLPGSGETYEEHISSFAERVSQMSIEECQSAYREGLRQAQAVQATIQQLNEKLNSLLPA